MMVIAAEYDTVVPVSVTLIRFQNTGEFEKLVKVNTFFHFECGLTGHLLLFFVALFLWGIL